MLKKSAILLIKGYRFFISPFLGHQCRFFPSCSLYAQIAVERYGFFYGAWLVFKRIIKCHPWYTGEGYDPVPERAIEKIKIVESL
ncbi:MAG: membrane protein insertion efficiency factor YidD [Gammaproteobacteria bacterium]|nr:membrane protein insertion efficiency factor YidD [Gammaproteobacteria bacterium]